MSESTQHKLDRVRPPRVQITYDVEIGDAIEMKELPFVVGIMADLSGHPEEELPKLKDRKFVEADRDNLNDIMASIGPRLAFRVPNTMQEDDTLLNVALRFNSMDDFSPEAVARQIEPLRKLLEARQHLVDLLAKIDGNDQLESLLQDVVHNTEVLQEIHDAVGTTGGDGAPAEAPDAPDAPTEEPG